MSEANRFTAQEWEHRLEGIDQEVVRQALVCQVPLLAPGAVERVLDGDSSVCGNYHAVAFKTLRGLLTMHFLEEAHLQASMDSEQGRQVAERVRHHLSDLLGNDVARLMG